VFDVPPDARFRAIVDLRWMRPGLAGGIENVGRAFLGCLQGVDDRNQYTVLLPGDSRYDLDTQGRPNLTLLAAGEPGHRLRRVLQRVVRLLPRWQRAAGRHACGVPARGRAELDADVAVSIPGYIQADLWPLANVLVVPDIQHEYCPEFFTPRVLAARRRLHTESARHAAHICAISEFTRQTLIERLRIPADRITTTHLAADPVFHTGSTARRDSLRVLAKYGLRRGEYLIFPANTWPHKNHRGAFHALRALRDGYGLDPLLVCTGSAKDAHGEVLAAIHELRLDNRVRHLGYCPRTDMPALYEGAAALVFPSLFEGFGIPLLEAMWCDCPVIASNTTSLPEIAGDAAMLIDPRSPEELAHALSRVLTDEGLRHALIERGRRRAHAFSWAEFTLGILRAAGGVARRGGGVGRS
jgi:glycosyltransferase involved in cell wall biosynthesis